MPHKHMKQAKDHVCSPEHPEDIYLSYTNDVQVTTLYTREVTTLRNSTSCQGFN